MFLSFLELILMLTFTFTFMSWEVFNVEGYEMR